MADPRPSPTLPGIGVANATDPATFRPYQRDPDTLARPWAVPGTPGLEHRIGGLEKADITGNVSYDPDNHHRMQLYRQAKVAGIATDIPPLEVYGPERGELLILGWGSTYGAIRSAVERLTADGESVAHAHLRHLNPFPANTEAVLRNYRRVLIPEVNLGQLLMLIRAKYLIDAVGYDKVRGKPFRIAEIIDEARRLLADRGSTMTETNGHAAADPTIAQPPLSAANAAVIQLTRKDFVSDQEVRWCPGCGDYSILAQTQKVMPDFGYARENIVFISGIGCSGRLPYYMNTYGFHTIHGRAPTLATGLKAARPDLMVWVITGDGDALSIGGNHVIHSMRRNVDINLVMFNNRIYGLTKGQASPTSEFGKKTKSTPAGTVDTPIMPLTIALAAEASFVARSVDTHTEHLQGTLERAGRHKGSLVRRGPPELQHLQRRGVARLHRPRGPRGPDARPRARQADDLRQGPRQGDPPVGPPPGGRHDRRERRHRGGPARPRRARRGAVPRADAVADVLAGSSRSRSASCARSSGRPTTRSSRTRSRPRSRGAARATWARSSTAARPGRSSSPGAGATSMQCPVCGFREPDGSRGLRQLWRGPGRCGRPAADAVLPRPAAR